MSEEKINPFGTDVLYLTLAGENSRTIVPFKNIRSIHEVVDAKLIAKGYRSQIVFLGADEGAFYVTEEITEIASKINLINEKNERIVIRQNPDIRHIGIH